MTVGTYDPAAAFSQQMRVLDSTRAPGSVHPLELLLDDGLVLRLSLHPDLRHWLLEAVACDVAALRGPLRAILVRTLLQINGAALEGDQIMCTLDASDLVVLMTRWLAPEREAADFLPWLHYTVTQARRIREMVRAIAMEDAGRDFSSHIPPSTGDSP